MASASDQDVERAMAALGASPIAYRSFRADASADDRPTPPSLAEFPLIAAALPEAASMAVPAAAHASGESAVAAAPLPVVPGPAATPTTPPAAVAQTRHEPLARLFPPPAEPVAASAPSHVPPRPPEPAPAASPPAGAWGRPAEAPAPASTPLAAMFRILRTGASRSDHPPEPRRGLQDLFRRL